MAKPLTLLNQDIAQAYRLHSITQPPAAFELTDLDKELLQTIMATNTSTRQKVDKFHNILHRYKNILEQFQDSNTQPTPSQTMPPSIPPAAIPKQEPKKEEPFSQTVPIKPIQRTPKSKAIIDLQKMLEERDPSFNAKPGNIVVANREISDKTFNTVMQALKKKNPIFTVEQRKLLHTIYDSAKTHPNFISLIKTLPGLGSYVKTKTTMTTRTDKASPFDARRNIPETVDDDNDDDDDDNYEDIPPTHHDTFENDQLDPNLTAAAFPSSSTPIAPPRRQTRKNRKSIGSKITKKGAGGIVHLKRWQKHIKKRKK